MASTTGKLFVRYTIRLGWGGFHPDIVLLKETGDLAYVMQGRWLIGRRQEYRVKAASGEEIATVRRDAWIGNVVYLIKRWGETVGRVGTKGLRSRGFIEVANLAPVRWEYELGPKKSVALSAPDGEIGRITPSQGSGVRGTVEIDSQEFDAPEFLVACALVFSNWTSRG